VVAVKPLRTSDLKTYSHLARAKRVPSEYELATSDLLYYRTHGGFEVETPLAAWYARHQRGSALACDDWEAFRDPRETTYAKYTQIQRAQEAHVDALLEHVERSALSSRLSAECTLLLEGTLPVLRYPVHGLMMIAAYVGQMAPAGRIVIASAFQAADEMRRVQRLAQRMALFGSDFGMGARATWEEARAWQPLRELVEKAMVTWDWGEALVALNLCIKPVFDHMFTVRLAEAASVRGAQILPSILASLGNDCEWHQAWALALCDVATDQRPENRAVIERWMSEWRPRAARAIEALAPAFETPTIAEATRVQ
jgi:toluene monooxygenase system protein E